MNCRACQEEIAGAARAGAAPKALLDHLAHCTACRRFAAEMVEVTAALSRWKAPQPDNEATRAALAVRLAAARRHPVARGSRRPANRFSIHPAVMAAPAAGAIIIGATMAPGWVQQVVAGWMVFAAVLVSLVLMQSGCGAATEGEG